MRGEVLHYDESQGFGFITAQDGSRYTFAREDLRRDTVMSKGTVVEFQPSGGQARDVFAIRAQFTGRVPATGPAPAATVVPPAPVGQPQHFGRNATASPTPYASEPDASLWGYFIRAFTHNYANFRDRARRKEYWGFYLFNMILLVALVVVGMFADASTGNLNGDAPYVTMSLFGLYFLAMFIPGLAMAIRRQHDIGLSGWFYLLILLPYVGGLILFVFSVIPSQMHENKWGPVPAGIRVPPPFTPTATGTSR